MSLIIGRMVNGSSEKNLDRLTHVINLDLVSPEDPVIQQNLILNRAPRHDDPLNLNLQALADAAAVIPGHPVIADGSDAVFEGAPRTVSQWSDDHRIRTQTRSYPCMFGLTTR